MDADRLRELVCYLPRSGMFFRRNPLHGRCPVLGRLSADGYRTLFLDTRLYLAHRLAWLYVHGEWPAGVIDHINGDRADNRVANLRVVTPWQNALNKRSRKGDGALVGAYWIHDSRWEAITSVNGRRVLLGFYPTEERAHRAYLEYNASIGRVVA